VEFLPNFLPGIVTTVVVTSLSAAFGLVVAFIAGVLRMSRWGAIRAISNVYVEVFRGTSLLVQIFYLYFVLPLLGVRLDPLPTAVIALGLNFGAYGSEIVRTAIANVDRAQREAAVALGFSPWATLRRIVFPQALASMFLPFGNLLVELLKGSALVSLISLADVAFIAKLTLFATARPAEVYGIALVVYFLLAIPLTRSTRALHRRAVRRLHLGPSA
jgi:polar amino acid transport system permease protein